MAAARAQGPVIIDFEGLPLQNGRLQVSEEFRSKGVVFRNATAVSSPTPAGFAHSGNTRLDSCIGTEVCATPIEIAFMHPVKRVKVWVGVPAKGRFTAYLQLIVRHGDMKKSPNLKKSIAVTEPRLVNGKPAFQMVPLEITLESDSILGAYVGLAPGGDVTSISIDDLEFESSPVSK
jgi:hypothetical protein